MPAKGSSAALLYTAISLAAALLFLAATYATRKPYPLLARLGGAAWVFLLSMIITMPLVISRAARRHGSPPPS
ncbi:hypothetical protein [Desulfovirgula thermocuniculi]|uniref:hypothetical protein n=1 Tax=Desulfovirgula thermocuniculi TaxID=348842 RepID=UPI00042364BF